MCAFNLKDDMTSQDSFVNYEIFVGQFTGVTVEIWERASKRESKSIPW